jgi:hypothetical protein
MLIDDLNGFHEKNPMNIRINVGLL